MLEKLVLTLSSLTLALTLGSGYVWVQGGFEPSRDLSSVARDVPEAAPYTGPTTLESGPPPASARPVPTPAPRRTAQRAARPPGRQAAAPLLTSLAARTAAGALPYDARTTSGTVSPLQSQVPDQTPNQTPAQTPNQSHTQTPTQTPNQTPARGRTPDPTPQTQSGPRADFNVATFNLRGSSHTRGSSTMAPGPVRMVGAVRILAQHDVTIAGLQEFQTDQRQAFARLAPGWATYPGGTMGPRTGENSVVWRTDTWSVVDKGVVSIPYFYGNERPMPWVLLRNKASGRQVYFSTFHNPADVRGPAQRWRTEATNREVRLFNRLAATGVPQIVTGDMNERANYFCRITSETRLHAAAGGENNGSCRPPTKPLIDWIFGSPSVSFSGYVPDRSDLVRRTTDHPVVVSRVTLAATN